MTEGLTVSLTVSQGVVRRWCGSDGLWEKDDSGQVWRDMTQCEEEKEVTSQEVKPVSSAQNKWLMLHLDYIGVNCCA